MSSTGNATAKLLGGISITHLTVYDDISPDGQAGGSPHVHLACAEAYFVLGGAGAVETITIDDGFRRIELSGGVVVHFDPGVVHRLVNKGGLELLVLMQNAGLPERGDAVFTFPPHDLTDRRLYLSYAQVRTLADARARRDRAVEGFMLLRQAFDAWPETGRQRLAEFHHAAAALVEAAVGDWRSVVAQGPGAAVAATFDRLEAITAGLLPGLDRARVIEASCGEPKLGMCGQLHPLLIESDAIAPPSASCPRERRGGAASA